MYIHSSSQEPRPRSRPDHNMDQRASPPLDLLQPSHESIPLTSRGDEQEVAGVLEALAGHVGSGVAGKHCEHSGTCDFSTGFRGLVHRDTFRVVPKVEGKLLRLASFPRQREA